MINLIGETTGNTLAYGLSALKEAMSYGFGWEALSPEVIRKIVGFVDSSNLNVVRSTLEILIILCNNPEYGFKTIEEAVSAAASTQQQQQQQPQPSKPFSNLVNLLVMNMLSIYHIYLSYLFTFPILEWAYMLYELILLYVILCISSVSSYFLLSSSS